MAVNYQYGSAIAEAVRNILLCRVKLAASASSGTDEVTVSNSTDRLYPGNRFFLNNTTACTIVQPTSADTASGIEHQENLTLDESSTYATDDKLAFTSNLANSYTTAAYVRPATLPSVSSGLKFIDSDFIPSLNFAPKDEWFPGAIVTRMGMKQDMVAAAGMYQADYHLRVYYCDILHEDRNNSDTLFDAGEALRDLVTEDNYLAGTALESNVTELTPWFSTDLTQRGFRFATATHGIDVGWVQFDILVTRFSPWKKHDITE